jgi:Protein of unknown function (DUF3144)
MTERLDDSFYDRADAFIHLANQQCSNTARGKVSASLLYAAARFNAWISARDFESGAELSKAKREIVEYFVKQYRAMLVDNLDDYVEHVEKYVTSSGTESPRG